MTRRTSMWLVVAIALSIASVAEAGQYILRARSDADADVLCKRYGLVDIRLIGHQGQNEICLVTANTSSAAEDAALRALVAADPLTVSIEIDGSLQLVESAPASAALAQSTAAILEGFGATPPAFFFGSLVPAQYFTQPATALIRLSSAQSLATGVGIVAVIDTGVDPAHQALAGALVPGFDFIHGVPGVPTDLAEISQSTAALLEQATAAAPGGVAILNQSTAAILEQSTAAILEGAPLPAAFGHGTMVAGLVHLVAPTASIMPLKAFTADGTASMSDLVSAIYFATDNGATVINMSFTLAAPSQALFDAIVYATNRGVLCVAAVGNGGIQVPGYPAAWPGVIAVASTTMADQRSAFSNYGSRVDMSAPGEALLTVYPGNHYAAVWGTSFATALVSGAAALIDQFAPRLNEAAVLKVLEAGAPVPNNMGKARLDLYRALRELLSEIRNP